MKKENKDSVHVKETKRVLLTLEILRDVVLEGIQSQNDNENNSIRNFEVIRQWLSFLFGFSIEHAQTDDNKNDEEVRIVNEVKENALLLGFTHYVCDGDMNPFNWSYYLKCREKFAKFLYSFSSHIAWVVEDLDAILNLLQDDRGLTFVVDGYLVLQVKLSEGKKVFSANICFDHLNGLYKVPSNEYRLIVKREDTILGVFKRAYKTKLGTIMDFLED